MTALYLILLIVVFACGSPHENINTKQREYLNGISPVDTIAFKDLSLQAGDTIIKNYYFHNNQLYSGQAVEYQMANDGRWSFVYAFENGIMMRLDVYGIDGYRHRFVEMKNGYDHHTVMYYRNGNKYLEEFYDENKNPIGIWKRWHESGALDWEKNYE